MLRRRSSGERLRLLWETPDPDVEALGLSKLVVSHTDSVVDALWQHLFDLDPRDVRYNRDRQIVSVARHARVGSPGDLLGWDEVDVHRLRELTEAVQGVLDDESAATSAVDR